MVVSRTLRVDGRETLARLAGRTIIIDGCWVAELGRLRELGWKLELPSCPEASAAFTLLPEAIASSVLVANGWEAMAR